MFKKTLYSNTKIIIRNSLKSVLNYSRIFYFFNKNQTSQNNSFEYDDYEESQNNTKNNINLALHSCETIESIFQYLEKERNLTRPDFFLVLRKLGRLAKIMKNEKKENFQKIETFIRQKIQPELDKLDRFGKKNFTIIF